MANGTGSASNPPLPRAYRLTLDELNRTRYFGRDFFTFYDDVVFRIQTAFFTTFQNFIASDPAMMLVDMACWSMDLLSFYLDRRSTETYLATMRERRSVSIQTRTIGYKMHGAVPATVDLEVTLDEAYAFVVTYPKGWQWDDASGGVWESLTDLIFLPGELGPKTVTLREGETKIETFVSDGTISQRYDLSVPADMALAWESDEVRVGATQWNRADFLPYMAGNYYEVDYNGRPPWILFGDGITGNIPAAGDTITARYVRTRGAAGRILAERIEGPRTPLVIGGTQIKESVVNPLPSNGGDNAEDLRRAKSLAPLVYKARDVNITRSDYVARATGYSSSAYGAVTMAQAYAARSAASDVALTMCVDQIRNGLLYYSGLIGTDMAEALADIALVFGHLNDVEDEIASAGTHAAAADGDFDDVTTQTTAVRVATSTQEVALQALEGILDGWLAALKINAGERAAAQGQIDLVRTQKTQIEGAMGIVASAVTDGKTEIAALQTDLSQASAAEILASARLTDAGSHVSQGQTHAASLSNGVNGALDCIESHVDSILSDDCKANLVIVPILSTSADGFYAPPTLSLIAAVQDHLDQRKEVTQTVEVVDGSYYLVPAQIEVELGVLRGYIGEEIVAVVDRNVKAILRKRRFGLNLYQSDIHDQCDSVDGVDHSNVRITGPADHLDADGNLVVSEQETITLGALSITYVVSNPPE